MGRILLLGVLFATSAAWAAESRTVLRFAVIAPDGTPWARELRAFARDVETQTQGRVAIKWYFGGVAGDEFEALSRIEKGQLDGNGGALFCERISPSLKVARITGLLQDQRELAHLYGKLRPTIDREFRERGFVNLGLASFGRVILFTRKPVASLDDLRRMRLWVWRADEMATRTWEKMGVKVVPMEVTDAGPAYDEKKHDGFHSISIGALAFQWQTRTPYFTDLTLSLLPACITIAQRRFDALAPADREALRAAAAKLSSRIDDAGDSQEAQLVSHLFEKQGLKRVPVSPDFRKEFLEAARQAREQLAEVPSELVSKVLGWLADYRAERPGAR